MNETDDSELLMHNVVEIAGLGAGGGPETTAQLNDVVVFGLLLLLLL